MHSVHYSAPFAACSPLCSALLCAWCLGIWTLLWVFSGTRVYIYCLLTEEVLRARGCLLLFFSRPVMSSSSWPHGLQHARPLCPSPSLEVCLNSCPLHRWCHSSFSSSDALFFHPQSFPVSGTFPMSQLFASTKILEFQLQHPSFQQVFGLISLEIDWFDPLAVQHVGV